MRARPLFVATAFAFVLAAAAPSRPAGAQEAMVGEFKLPGGAAVVTAEDHATKRVVVETWIGAGSAQDFPGFGGVAAATARALWRGAKGGLHAGARALGGDGMMEVDRDFTRFQLRLPADKLEDGVNLVGAALAAPDWDALAPEAAIQGLGDDLARLGRNPEAVAFEAFMAQAFPWAYGHPVAGDAEAGKRLGRGEAKAFFDRYYVPGRLRVVLAGDFATGKAVGMVVRSYAAVLKRTAPVEAPPARGAVAWKGPVARSMVVLGVKGPDVRAPREQAAMEMVGHVLGARLGKALGAGSRSEGEPGGAPDVARLVGTRFSRYAGESPLTITIEARPDAVPAVEKGVREAFDALRQNPARLDEHARAMVAVANAATPDPKDLAGRARGLGFAATVAGDPHWLRTYPEIVRQVSRQDMMEAVQKYAPPDAIKSVVLTP